MEENFISPLSQASLEKAARLRDAGINPYPYEFILTHAVDEVRRSFSQLADSNERVSIASRVMSQRSSGKNLIFLDLAATAHQIRQGLKIQVMVRRNEVESTSWYVIENLGLGDWLGVNGVCQYTKSGEPTIIASQITMLCKSLRPIPLPKIYENDKGEVRDMYAVQDIETLWRYPELDMLVRQKANTLVARSRILNAVRNTLIADYGCVELETPFLNAFFGGAEAAPFTTHLKALNQEVYLAISPEIELKRAIVGGMGTGGDLGSGVFYIARNFRNEGVDRTHNPEFTSMEVYIPFVDFDYMMNVTEKIFANACISVHQSTKCTYAGHTLDFGKPWPRLLMTKLVYEQSGIDVENLSTEDIRLEIERRELHLSFNLDEGSLSDNRAARQELLKLLETTRITTMYDDLHSLSIEDLRTIALRHKLHKPIDLMQEWDFLILDLFEIYCEPNLIEPCHVLLHPAKSTILCKEYRHGPLPNGNKLIERFESFSFGMELSNAYSELNDPLIQRKLVEEQAGEREHGKENAMPHNEAFLRSLEMGLPPCGGLGIGIDRMVMLLTDSRTIRDVIAFPLVGKT